MMKIGKRLVAFGMAAMMVLCVAGCSEHTPAPVPEVVPLTAAAKEAAYSEHVRIERDRLLSMHPAVDIPDVDRLRYVSPEEWAFTLAECLTAEGFETAAHADGGIRSAATPPEQAEAQGIAIYTCSVRYPVDPQYSVPLNHEQIGFLFDYLVGELIPCLEDSGYEIPAPPSWQTFEETLGSAPWSPYNFVSPVEEEDWLAINLACPQQPNQLFGPGT